MARTREIKGRIKAVTNIQRITKTMQMIATARFQAAQRRATATQPYTCKISEMVSELAAALAGASGGAGGGNATGGEDPSGTSEGGISHPLLRSPWPAANRQLVLVLTSNRGLAGAYNGNVLRKANHYLREQGGPATDLEVVGKKGLAYFRFNRVPVAQALTHFTDRPSYESVEALAERYIKEFARGRYDSVQVVYMGYQSMARQSPVVMELLPLRPPAAAGEAKTQTASAPAAKTQAAAEASVEYEFSPDAATLLAELLPVTVKARLFQAFNEAVVSEQIARMVAMKSATDAAGKMKKSLTRVYNRARQTAITTELSEIIGGSAALE